jgi:broad-specificity NMP kinase
MIIELFGPPGVGKTTFACALAVRLRKRYKDFKLLLSYRPSEYPLAFAESSARLRAPATLQRLVRPMIESFAATPHAATEVESHPSGELIGRLAKGNVIQTLRLRQYLIRLNRKWRAAEDATVTLFDQAFVQVICSSAQLNGTVTAELVAHALDAVPQADLLIRLTAPEEILAARLAERRRRQGRIERLLDRRANREAVWVYDKIYELLRARGRSVITVDSTSHGSLMDGVDRVETIVVGRLGTIPAENRARENGGGHA